MRWSSHLLIVALALGLMACRGSSPRTFHRHIGPEIRSSDTRHPLLRESGEKTPLPPATLSTAQILQEFREIELSRHQGESRALEQRYAERAKQEPSLENRLLAALALEDEEESWEQIALLSREYPDFYWSHAAMAKLYAHWKVDEHFEQAWQSAYSLAPKQSWNHTLRGLQHLEKFEYREALAAYERALQQDPANGEARLGKVLSLWLVQILESEGAQGGLRGREEQAKLEAQAAPENRTTLGAQTDLETRTAPEDQKDLETQTALENRAAPENQTGLEAQANPQIREGQANLNKALEAKPETQDSQDSEVAPNGPKNSAPAQLSSLKRAPLDPEELDALDLHILPTSLQDSFISELKQALNHAPQLFVAAELLARLLEARQSDEAAQAWERVVQLSPHNRKAQLILARHKSESDVEGAIAAFEGAAKSAALDAGELSNLSDLYQRASRPRDEASTLEQLIQIRPENLDARLRLASLRESLADWEEARSAYRGVLERDPNSGPASLGLARALEQQVRLGDSLKAYRRAADLGEEQAKKAVERLERGMLLPKRPLRGNSLNHLYGLVVKTLEEVYEARKGPASLGTGKLRARVVAASGKVSEVEVVENTLGDPFVAAHLHFVLETATWRSSPSDPTRFTLSFDLPPQKQ